MTAYSSSDEVHHYSYVHTNPVKGTNQYRILEIDRDGKMNYSQVRAVFIKEASDVNVLSTYIRNHVIELHWTGLRTFPFTALMENCCLENNWRKAVRS
jgi:hypothetical protein